MNDYNLYVSFIVVINDVDFDVNCGDETVYYYTFRSNSTIQSLTIDYTCYYTNGSLVRLYNECV